MASPKPPRSALNQLKAWGHTIDRWLYRDEWWCGYSATAICTVAVVTGKILVEVCTQKHYAELLDLREDLPHQRRLHPRLTGKSEPTSDDPSDDIPF